MPPQINRDVWGQTPETKKIAVVIAGAGSLGSYEAGVLCELTYALDVLNGTLNPGEGRFVLDVLTGASAGGMNAAMLARTMMYESRQRERLHSAWVREIHIDGLLEDDPQQRNAILSKNIIRTIATKHLAGPAQGAFTASTFAPDLLRLGLTLSSLNGLDYKLNSRSLTDDGPGFLTTRFSDQADFVLTQGGFAQVEWPLIVDSAIACGNFPLAFMPQALMRDVIHYQGTNQPRQALPASPPAKSYFPHALAYVDGGLFDNEPLGMGINFAADADGGHPDVNRLFLLIHPNITQSAHRDADGTTGYLSGDLGLGAQIKRLLGMLMTENAVSDWVRAHKVNDLVQWRNTFVQQLTTIIQATQIPNPAPLIEGLQDLATTISRSRQKTDPPGYLSASLQRIQTREATAHTKLATAGIQQSARQRIFLLVLFVLDHIADLQDKAPVWLEVIGHDIATPLAGSQVNGFAGFFNQQWRGYDYRRGRVDGRNAFTGTGGQSRGILGDYPREPIADQPSRPTSTDPDEYNTDVEFWRNRLNTPRFPKVTFEDIDKAHQKAFRNRIADRVKATLGISGVAGVAFDLFVRPKIDGLLHGDEG